ncbi:MarR family winged helix-turn-helix transcriptional regulator [Rhodanobacter lindaniclasticus]
MKRPKDAAALAIFELTNSLQPITRAWFVAVNIVLKEYGHANSVRGAVILAARRAKNPIRQSELADAIGVNPGAMVRILDQAEEAGLLERRALDTDRRVFTVHATAEGLALAKKMDKAVTQLREWILEGLPAKEVQSAVHVLRLFESRIGEFVQKERMGR